MVLAAEVANATNVKTAIMERLALKNVRLAARPASWWMVLSPMRIVQGNSCQQVIAKESAQMIITGTDVKFHAQQIARSTQVKPAVQRTRDFASNVRPANGMAILAASLAVRAAFKAHVTKVREHVIAAARTDGGETRVSINAQQVQKVAATARMVNHRAVCQVLSRAWRMMVQESASLAQQIAKTEFVMTTVLAVKAAS